MKSFLSIFYLASLFSLALVLNSCEKDGETLPYSGPAGRVLVEITDAPIDEENVVGVFVTVSEVRVDSVRLENLSERQTFELSALTDGRTRQLGTEEYITAGPHASLEVVLDMATDANGNSPGCYVLYADGRKEDLSFGIENEVVLRSTEGFSVKEDETNLFVVDLDLRKAIKRPIQSSNDLSFFSNQNIDAATRIFTYENTGRVRGTVASMTSDIRGKVVLYAYRPFRFNSELEMANDFRNAVTSALIKPNGTFSFPFLLEGDYDIIAVEYIDSDADGKLEFSQFLASDAALGLNTRKVSVTAVTEIKINLALSTLLP